MESLLYSKEFNSCNLLLMSDETQAKAQIWKLLDLGSKMGLCSRSRNQTWILAWCGDVPDLSSEGNSLHVKLFFQ